MINQLHVVSTTTVASGGEGLAALRYAESLAKAGCSVTFISRYLCDGKISDFAVTNGSCTQQIVPLRKNIVLELFAQYHFITALCNTKKIDLIHIHGMWTPILAVAAFVAKKKSLPLVISAHGCLEPWALQNKGWKKRLALWMYQGAILHSASLLVATAPQEMESLRKMGLHQPIAVIPNGVDIEEAPPSIKDSPIKTFLFLSRIDPKKGLLDLVEAWCTIRRPDWCIVIAGPDQDGYQAIVENLIQLKGLEAEIKFIGLVQGARKKECFESASIFILPTYSENFGLVVAEALSNNLPVITTTGAPWQELIEHQCGWWVDPGVKGISEAMVKAMDCDPKELEIMGSRGRQLVINKYSWDTIGGIALEVSEWLLNRTQNAPAAIYGYK